ncbi:hypothetical protein E8E95_13260 [Pseudomonas sp. BN414]|uniref:hypothetical protein n=1 Tax=Pseudomonas sp. BN414 TaxID=2567888 RepID=UPI002456257B|nr:hypothetical protein [Pseudomonas sp. BN414]MDH4567650.1 hypothetical protein [Pseudomonas sp. BN414]
MIEPVYWTELRQLSLNVSAAHIAMVAFLEEAVVPWSDDQMVEFERLILCERIAISAYATLYSYIDSRTAEPARLRLVVGE